MRSSHAQARLGAHIGAHLQQEDPHQCPVGCPPSRHAPHAVVCDPTPPVHLLTHPPDQSGRHQYELQAGTDVLHAHGTFDGGAVTDEAWEEAMVGVGKDRRGQ